MSALQKLIFDNIYRRGYGANRTPFDMVRQQVLKSIEELGEVARQVFDGQMPDVAELADVCIPMFVAAQVIANDREEPNDLAAVMFQKSLNDVNRGVR